ncbi:DMT family transporter [Paralimibaculum aggregatum]|uniref:DMT family transporter n=1 Tax=Paralimibaculum aggregatum TaxID=3036245 RepID=A0ABQ6LRK5_9RHOB|nr:DMT family transporter [Limibaculum sp. NKW23]GMG84089.1 DMT family transporter [Limibaculum sp. NKW23]
MNKQSVVVPAQVRPVRGILFKLASVALFSVMAACIKAARVEVPAGETVFFRAFVALAPVLAYAAWTGRMGDALTTRNLRGHFWRGLIGCSAMGLSFAALGLLPLPEVIALGFAAPLIATGLAVLLLGEVVRLYRWTAVAVGLAGVVVMVWPRLTIIRADGLDGLAEGAALGAACMLVAAFLMALAQIQVRWLTRTEPTLAIVFWFHVSCSLASLATLPFGWEWPTAAGWALLVTAGMFGGVAQIFVTESYRHADASTIAPFDYSSMLYGLLIGWLIFDEVPEPMVLAGAAIVVAAGLFILERERRLGLLAAKAKARPGITPQG